MEFKQQYFDIWISAWNLHKRYFGTDKKNDQAWKCLYDEYEILNKKFSCKFAERLLATVISELERAANAEKS